MTTQKYTTIKKSSYDIDRLTQEIEKMNTNKNSSSTDDEERYWKLDVDKAGNGQAVIRFLPPPPVDGDDALPFVKLFTHGFQGPTGKWYIEHSLTTLNQRDPLSELNASLWNESDDDNSPGRKQARAQKRKLNFISNVLVISDPFHPENEGKVFLFRYGKKIFDKVNQSMKPEFPGDPKVNPFDPENGANLRLRRRKGDGGFPNYDASVFEAPSSITDDEDELLAIWNKEYSLKDLISPDKFKSYDDLKKQLDFVLGSASTQRTPEKKATPVAVPVDDGIPWDTEDAAEDTTALFKDLADE
jgi:hypothetical protein